MIEVRLMNTIEVSLMNTAWYLVGDLVGDEVRPHIKYRVWDQVGVSVRERVWQRAWTPVREQQKDE